MLFYGRILWHIAHIQNIKNYIYIYIYCGSIKSEPSYFVIYLWCLIIYKLLLKLSRYLENSTNNMIQTHIQTSVYKYARSKLWWLVLSLQSEYNTCTQLRYRIHSDREGGNGAYSPYAEAKQVKCWFIHQIHPSIHRPLVVPSYCGRIGKVVLGFYTVVLKFMQISRWCWRIYSCRSVLFVMKSPFATSGGRKFSR